MDRAEPEAVVARRRERAAPRDDVQALQSLVALDEDATKREAKAARPRDAVAASAGPGEGRADLSHRRMAIASRIPREALDIYEDALRRGLRPAAVATRGRVCWGCFHRLSAPVAAPFLDEEAFLCCPHCERLLFNPDWTERR